MSFLDPSRKVTSTLPVLSPGVVKSGFAPSFQSIEPAGSCTCLPSGSVTFTKLAGSTSSPLSTETSLLGVTV